MKRSDLWRLPLALLAGYAPGLIGGLAMIGGPGAWYAELAKPWFNPPAAVFGPAWTLLYALIGVAVFLLWRCESSVDKTPVWVAFWTQAVLNGLWTPVFFGLHLCLPALVILVALIAAIWWFILGSRRVSPVAAWLLVPYLAWCHFAALLNARICWLNR